MNNDPFLLRRADAAELYLIRHGDAIPGPEEIIPSGTYDDLPLSKTGREQARQLAERLKAVSFAAAYSSPLRRCLETAAPLLSYLNMTPTIVEEMKEISIGRHIVLPDVSGDKPDLAALTRALQDRQAEMVRVGATTGHWNDVTLGESSRDFRRRVVQTIDSIALQHIGDRVLLFCHGGVINAYVAEVLGLEKDFFFPCANTSISLVRMNADIRVLFTLNDVAHLRL